MKKGLKILLISGLFGLLALTGCTVATEQAHETNCVADAEQAQETSCVVDAWRAGSLEYEPPQLYVSLESEQDVRAIAWHMGYTVFYEDGNIAGGAQFDSPHPSELLLKDFYSATLQLSHDQNLPLDLQFIGMDFNYGNPPSGDSYIISVTRFRVEDINGAETVYGDFYSGEIVELMAAEEFISGVFVDVISILDDGFDYIYLVQPRWQEGQIRWDSLFAFRVNSGINACSESKFRESASVPFTETTSSETTGLSEDGLTEEQRQQVDLMTAKEFGEIIIRGDLLRRDFIFPGWHMYNYEGEERIVQTQWGSSIGFRVLLTSGFERIEDVRAAFLSYFTEEMVDGIYLLGWGAAFYEEYNDNLYFFPYRACGGEWIWEDASFEIIKQEGKHTVIEVIVPGTAEGQHWIETIHYTFLYDRISERELIWE